MKHSLRSYDVKMKNESSGLQYFITNDEKCQKEPFLSGFKNAYIFEKYGNGLLIIKDFERKTS